MGSPLLNKQEELEDLKQQVSETENPSFLERLEPIEKTLEKKMEFLIDPKSQIIRDKKIDIKFEDWREY